MDFYREEILAHWQNPLNFGVMEKPDLVIEQVNPLCGDEVTFYFRLSPPVSSWSGNDHDKRACFSQARNRITDLDSIAHSVRSRMTKKDSRVIKDVSFTGSGCAISMAAASMLSDAIKGRKVSELDKITGQDVLSLIGGPSTSLRPRGSDPMGSGFPPARLKCAFLALEALRKLPSLRLRTSRVNSQEISD